MPRKKQPSTTQSQAITQQYTMEFLKIKRLPNLKTKAEQLTAMLDKMLVIDDSQLTSTDQEKLQQLAYEVEDELTATQNQIKSSFKGLVISLVLLFIFILTGIGAFFGYRYYHKQWPFGGDSTTTITDDDLDNLGDPETPASPSTPKPQISNGNNIVSILQKEFDSLQLFPDNQIKLDSLDNLLKRILTAMNTTTTEPIRNKLASLSHTVNTIRALVAQNIENQKTIGEKKGRIKDIDTTIETKENQIKNLREIFKKEDYTIPQLQARGATIQDLKDIGFTNDELKTNGITAFDISQAGEERILSLSPDEKKKKITTLEEEVKNLRAERTKLIQEVGFLEGKIKRGKELKESLVSNLSTFQVTMNKLHATIIKNVETDLAIDAEQKKQFNETRKKFGELQKQRLQQIDDINTIIKDLRPYEAALIGIKTALQRGEKIANRNVTGETIDNLGLLGKCIKFFVGNPFHTLEKSWNNYQSKNAIAEYTFEKPSSSIECVKAIQNALFDPNGKIKDNITVGMISDLETRISGLISKYQSDITQLNNFIKTAHSDLITEMTTNTNKATDIVDDTTKITNDNKTLVTNKQVSAVAKSKVEFENYINSLIEQIQQEVILGDKTMEVFTTNKKLIDAETRLGKVAVAHGSSNIYNIPNNIKEYNKTYDEYVIKLLNPPQKDTA